MPSVNGDNRGQLSNHADLAAAVITLLGLLARLWTASGTFLNPDEALHFRLANQASLALAYRAGLTASHPPLLTLLLHFWRDLGTSELWLRLPSVFAGAVFCWMFYKWLAKAAGNLAAFIGLLLAAFLPPIVLLGAEVRQYSLLLAFLACAIYFLDEAFARNSPPHIAAFSLFLYLAMLSHYSAFLFAAALGIYALIRILAERPSARMLMPWVFGQLGALALAVFLYKTHISKLGAGESRTALQGWMSEFYLRHSYFDSTHDNPLTFLFGHTFAVFQYFFGQLAAGDVMGLLFLVGAISLLRRKAPSAERPSVRSLGLFFLLAFAIAATASFAHVYPYGGTRHAAFLIIPGIAGISVAIARLAANRWSRGVTIATLVIVICVAFARPPRPRLDRADQSRAKMAAALEFVNENVGASDLLFTDYMSDLVIGHYLCRQQPISFEASSKDFEAFSCGHRVVSASYKAATLFTPETFLSSWQRLIETYRLKSGDAVWIIQAGWDVNLPEDLQNRFAEFHDLRFESFGKNIKIFKMTVGQPMPAAVPQSSLKSSLQSRTFRPLRIP
jgi:4-amino-4-deoxy-L-arabinose transferase-like glycosyltransferase